jgi:hypothetical protein
MSVWKIDGVEGALFVAISSSSFGCKIEILRAIFLGDAAGVTIFKYPLDLK